MAINEFDCSHRSLYLYDCRLIVSIMTYKKELDKFTELSRKLDAGLLQCNDKEILPLSFFSQSYDILKEMMTLLQSIEELQVSKMQEQLNFHKKFLEEQISRSVVTSTVIEKAVPELKEEEPKEVSQVSVNEETKDELHPKDEPVSSKKAPHSYQWKMSISDRFLFLKGLFASDKEVMETVMKDLETLSSLSEAVIYLDERFGWDWEEEVPSIFKFLLEGFYE